LHHQVLPSLQFPGKCTDPKHINENPMSAIEWKGINGEGEISNFVLAFAFWKCTFKKSCFFSSKVSIEFLREFSVVTCKPVYWFAYHENKRSIRHVTIQYQYHIFAPLLIQVQHTPIKHKIMKVDIS
jgi:hypothetical protein